MKLVKKFIRNGLYTGLDKSVRLDYDKAYESGELGKLTDEKLACNQQLKELGDFVPLNITFDCEKLLREISEFKESWSPYMSSTAHNNKRYGLPIIHHKQDIDGTPISIQDGRKETQQPLTDLDYTKRTRVIEQSSEIEKLVEKFEPIYRSYLIRLDAGGFFPPHRDQLWLGRDTFRLVGFVNKCSESEFVWLHDNKRIDIKTGRLYLVNTQLRHQTFSYVDGCTHIIMNPGLTLKNVLKVISAVPS